VEDQPCNAQRLKMSAICIGRAYAYGLAAFGQPGVEAVLEMLRRELHIAMAQAGSISVGGIRPAYLSIVSRVRCIFVLMERGEELCDW
jgi:4-hydroxymandelate oxidase